MLDGIKAREIGKGGHAGGLQGDHILVSTFSLSKISPNLLGV